MTTQHTTGPWRLSSGDETEIFSGARPVARAHCGGLTSVKLPEAEANARLIAAAPEMLAALQAAVNLLSWGEAFNSDLPDATPSEKNSAKKVDEFKAIIARATATP